MSFSWYLKKTKQEKRTKWNEEEKFEDILPSALFIKLWSLFVCLFVCLFVTMAVKLVVLTSITFFCHVVCYKRANGVLFSYVCNVGMWIVLICGYEVPGMFLLRDSQGAMRLGRYKDMSIHVSTWTSYGFNTLTPVVWKLWR